MKYSFFVKRLLLPVLMLLVTINLFSQQDSLKQFIALPGSLYAKWNIRDEAAIKAFYEVCGYRYVWMGEHGETNRQQLVSLLRQAEDYGLDAADYQGAFISALPDGSGMNMANKMETEMRFTDAAISFFSDITFGNKVPVFSYDGLSYQPSRLAVIKQLAASIAAGKLHELSISLQPPMPEIQVIVQQIQVFRRRLADTGYKEPLIISTKASVSNKQLVRKLYNLGLLDSLDKKLKDKDITQYIKAAQESFGLLNDGVLRSTTLRELNIPVTERVKQLSLSVNYYRWLYCLSQQEPVVVVNIPAAYLRVYSEGRSMLDMRMVVGKPSTPTPSLSSRITDVVLYPYWVVPYSIATKELLPSIKKDPGFIDRGNFQVLNKKGKIINPYSVNWASISAANFPYTIRQSTGCDNALGVIKLNFYNPFSVYLHDTPYKGLFVLNKRFFSHGCMRLEKPAELAHFALGSNSIAVDTLNEKCLLHQSPVTVAVERSLPVVVWYNPVGVNAAGKLVYYEDVYNIFRGF